MGLGIHSTAGFWKCKHKTTHAAACTVLRLGAMHKCPALCLAFAVVLDARQNNWEVGINEAGTDNTDSGILRFRSDANQLLEQQNAQDAPLEDDDPPTELFLGVHTIPTSAQNYVPPDFVKPFLSGGPHRVGLVRARPNPVAVPTCPAFAPCAVI